MEPPYELWYYGKCNIRMKASVLIYEKHNFVPGVYIGDSKNVM